MNPFRNLYICFALLIPVTVFGFWETYFKKLDNLPDYITPLVHVHALLMMLWVLMLIAQAWFIRTKRFRPHRWVGRSSYVIAPLIIVLGLATLHHNFNRTLVDARQNVFAFGMVLAFGITWGLAIVYRKRTALHVRFMISTAFAIATAIVWRIFYFQVPGWDTNDAATAGNFGVLIFLLLVVIAADWRMGVKRSAFWVVTVLISVMHLGYWTFAKTEGYLSFCQWFADLPSWVG